MKRILQVALGISLISAFLLGGCAPAPVADDITTVEETKKMIIYAPASTSSIPVIIAASKMQNVELQLYTNQSQANTLFLRGEVSVLVTGLSVGLDLYKNDAPVQVINSFVSGLSYLVTYGKPVSSFAELKGQQIYIPFEGSPIEEATAYLTAMEGLTWKTDITPVYSPFDSSIELLKQGTATAVVLPEPNVTLVEGQPNIYISLSYFDEWNKFSGNSDGYPQVASFVAPDWAAAHPQRIEEFNQALADAIASVQQDPAAAVESVKDNYMLPAAKLLASLNRTHYMLTTGIVMQTAIENYYQMIGKPLDENNKNPFFFSAK